MSDELSAWAQQVHDALDGRELPPHPSDAAARIVALRTDLRDAVASLNDIVAELACGLASGENPSKGYAYTVVVTLAEHTRSLGGTPTITAATVEGWEGEQ